MIELLSPVGDFECLKAAVQNGADSVYFGANLFSARAFAHNFDEAELKKAIEYAKLRGVKTNLTLNTLIKDNEFDNAIKLASKAYEFGIDAIIIQDLGLAKKLIELFPDLPMHGSTQMTIHNLNGALKLQELGFKRVVLSRELSLTEIFFGYPASFGYDFVFYQWYHGITAADGKGSYLKENGECFKIYIHIQNVVIYFISLSSFPSFPLLAYWLGLILKCFLNTSRKYFASLKPVSSEISVMVCFCSFRSWAACFSRISRM